MSKKEQNIISAKNKKSEENFKQAGSSNKENSSKAKMKKQAEKSDGDGYPKPIFKTKRFDLF